MQKNVKSLENKYKEFILKAMAYAEPKIRLAKNVSDKLPEQDTCVILSMAFLIDKTPDEVWGIAKKYWRLKGGITNAHHGSILREFGYELKSRYDLVFKKGKDHSLTAVTFGQLLKILDKEPERSRAFLISVANHAIGVKNSKVLDTANTGDKKKVVFVNELVSL